MTDIGAFTESDMAEGEQYPTLGPAYFAARRVCEEAISAFEAEHMKPLVEKFQKSVADELWTVVENHLWNDTESNLQGKMWRMVDEIIKGILSGGPPWVAERYALGGRYDCDAIRKALALSIKDQLGEAFHADLQEENEKLRKEMEYLRKMRY
jgi:hypothetical protein